MHLEDPPKLLQPRDHKARIAIWADLTVSDMDVLSEAGTTDQVKMQLAQIFGIDDHKENLKAGILLDLYFYTIQFARDNGFTKEQTSAFFSIVKQTHEVCIETPFGNVEQCFAYFRELVLCHAVKRPPYSIDLFTAEHVRAITDYVINTYFRHFKMYKYAFTPLVRLDLSMTYSGMPSTPTPAEAGDAGEQGDDADKDAEDGAARADGEDNKDDANDPINQGSQTDEVPDTQQEDEESAAAKELRSIIKKHLEEEIKKLRVSVDEQIKQSEDMISQKLQSVEGSSATKAGKASAKGRKK